MTANGANPSDAPLQALSSSTHNASYRPGCSDHPARPQASFLAFDAYHLTASQQRTADLAATESFIPQRLPGSATRTDRLLPPGRPAHDGLRFGKSWCPFASANHRCPASAPRLDCEE